MEPLRTAKLRSLLADGLAAGCSFAGILLLLRYLHSPERGASPATAGVGALVIGVVARRALRQRETSVPAIIRRPLLGLALAAGMILVTLSSLVGERIEYCVLVSERAIPLAGVGVALATGLALIASTLKIHARAIEEERVHAAELSLVVTAARLRALQAQMNPHFLFNTFNALAELVHSDPTAAEALIEDLAELLRYSLYSSTETRVPLRREWDAIERTLRIERARFGDRLRVTLHLDPAAADLLAPGLTVQPLVENAVAHAIAPKREGGRISVRARVDGSQVSVVVEDDGPGLPAAVLEALARGDQTPGGGTGGAGGALANVRARLTLTYPDQGELRAENLPSGGARLEVRWPIERGPVESAAVE